MAALAGSFLGLIVGGLLSEVDWRLVFFVSVPFGMLGTVWSYMSLHEMGTTKSRQARLVRATSLFAVGLTIVLVAITYGIQPYGDARHRLGEPDGCYGGHVRRRCCCWPPSAWSSPRWRTRCST